ncbi:hypothetical protein EDF60_0132 [Leucobacter luti]|uniref:hypothetical protein n=1 Tax=Leucobacter luti TaxID=340320 RepID=UPI00104B0C70|nr:hypothetical protein [Leucobacter luti]MCW2288934.1 hypothetical protein [Leucobacter luti]TCK44916.1 hypothetical protein EDF60_0132 [Leucobacter luti]
MTTQMRASAREMRHMVGRYLHARNCPGYAVNAVRDAIMAAQAEGYDAVSYMEDVREHYAGARTSFVAEFQGDEVVLDGANTPAPLLAPALIDELALAVAAGARSVRVHQVPGVTLFAALSEYAAVRGVSVTITRIADDAATIAASAVPPRAMDPAALAAGPAMQRILRDGYEMDADQFWRLFHESNEALTPDSELSRRHAGTQIYDADGNLLGEASEEVYQHLRSASGTPDSTVFA